MTEKHVFNSNLARAGRALVGISTWYIADETGIERKQIRKFERGIIALPEEQQEAIKRRRLRCTPEIPERKNPSN